MEKYRAEKTGTVMEKYRAEKTGTVMERRWKRRALMVTLLCLLILCVAFDICIVISLGILGFGIVVYFLPEIILIIFLWWLFKRRRK